MEFFIQNLFAVGEFADYYIESSLNYHIDELFDGYSEDDDPMDGTLIKRKPIKEGDLCPRCKKTQ